MWKHTKYEIKVSMSTKQRHSSTSNDTVGVDKIWHKKATHCFNVMYAFIQAQRRQQLKKSILYTPNR